MVDRELSLVLPLGASTVAPAAARHAVRQLLDGSVPPAVLADALLVVSELVSNAVMHAHRCCSLAVHVRTDDVLIAVDDDAGGCVAVRPTDDPLRPGGRGLRIVDEITSGWGVERNGHGKRVWATVPCGITRPSMNGS